MKTCGGPELEKGWRTSAPILFKSKKQPLLHNTDKHTHTHALMNCNASTFVTPVAPTSSYPQPLNQDIGEHLPEEQLDQRFP